MAKVLAIFAGSERELGGCEIYRTTMPFHYLKAGYGWDCQWAFGETIWKEYQKTGPGIFGRMAAHFDLFVLPRSYAKEEAALDQFKIFVEEMHKLGKPVIYEVDDDMTNKDRIVLDGNAMAVAKLCDAITVTTPYLKALMEQETGKKAYVLPNMVSMDKFREPFTGTFRYADKITLGLTGSPTHSKDWRVLETVLPKVVQDDNVHLIMMGYHPEYLAGLPNTSYIPGLPYGKYVQILQTCDIILAPLNNDPFNMGKSPIKVIEGMAARRQLRGENAGAACIASDHPVYQLAVKNGKNGLLVEHTPSAWQSGLDQLIYDDKLRYRLQLDGHAWVLRHHDIRKTASQWRNAYEAILKKPLTN